MRLTPVAPWLTTPLSHGLAYLVGRDHKPAASIVERQRCLYEPASDERRSAQNDKPSTTQDYDDKEANGHEQASR